MGMGTLAARTVGVVCGLMSEGGDHMECTPLPPPLLVVEYRDWVVCRRCLRALGGEELDVACTSTCWSREGSSSYRLRRMPCCCEVV